MDGKKPGKPRVPLSGKQVIFIILGIILVVYLFIPRSSGSEEIEISQVLAMAEAGQVKSIEVKGDTLAVLAVEGKTFKSRKEPGTSILELLSERKVATGKDGVEVKVGSEGFSIGKALFAFLPILLLIGLFLFMMRRTQQGIDSARGMGASKAKLHSERPLVKFEDVAGVEEAKQELQEVVEFLKYPERFMALGAKIPKGVLLVGQPGTGKTLLARAVAGEASVPFFNISGSEFVEMFVGVGAARVRDLFDQAKRNAPCIVFIDEIDAVGRHRGAGIGGGHDEREQTLNQILVEMDGFDTNTNIIIIAATNRPDILDGALLRPGRFDRKVVMDMPDVVGRKAILEIHAKGKPLSADVNLEVLARETPGFSGADLANVINEAALLAAREQRKIITMADFGNAVDRVTAGPERKSKVISKREKKITAYHESGHALVAWLIPQADKPHKISIISRGAMGGYTKLLPEEDRLLWTKNQFEDRLAVAMGGRVAEEIVIGDISTGASNDIEEATKIALAMVKRYAMSERLGPRTFGRREELVFLGKEISEERNYSEKVSEEIDREVELIMRAAYETAKKILTEGKAKLDQIAEYLLKNESVEGEVLKRLFEDPAPA